jgi:tetratricopeptide (TPR) repeat protein
MSAVMLLTVIGTISGAGAALVAWLEYLRHSRESKKTDEREVPVAEFSNAQATEKNSAVFSKVVAQPLSEKTAEGSQPIILRPPIGRLGKLRGRIDILDSLTSELLHPAGEFHVLVGLGGIGKTAVALSLAEIAVSRQQPAWWVSGVDAATVLASMMGLAAELGASLHDIQDAYSGSRDPADVLWARLELSSGWLLVIDNVDDLEAMRIGESAAGDGNGWLRRTTAGLIVVTGRVADKRNWGRFARVHLLRVLGENDGAQVLLDLAASAGSKSTAARLSARLGGLPLALSQAGHYLASPFAPERSFEAYMESLDRKFPDLFGDGYDRQSTLTSTWEISLDALQRRDRPQARSLLRVLACFAPSIEIPPILLDHEILGSVCEGKGASGVTPGLDALLSVGLVMEGTAPHPLYGFGVTIHPLVADSSRLHVTAGPFSTAVELVHRATEKLKIDNPDHWNEWSALVPHLQELINFPRALAGKRELKIVSETAALTCYALTWSGSYGRSVELADSALSYAAALDSDRSILYLHFQRVMALAYQGATAEAEDQYRSLIARQMATLGRNHPDVIVSQLEIAWVIFKQGRYEEAERELKKLLPKIASVLGPENRSTMLARTEQGRAIAAQGRYQEAEYMLREAFEFQDKFLGPGHQHTLLTKSEVADNLIMLGRYSEAEVILDEILDARIRLFGPDYPYTLIARQQLAKLANYSGSHATAERELQEIIASQTRILGIDHPDTLRSRFELGRSLALQGKVADAIIQLNTLLEAQGRALGEDHPTVQLTRNLLDTLGNPPI